MHAQNIKDATYFADRLVFMPQISAACIGLLVCVCEGGADHSNLKSLYIQSLEQSWDFVVYTLFILFLFRNYFESLEIWDLNFSKKKQKCAIYVMPFN